MQEFHEGWGSPVGGGIITVAFNMQAEVLRRIVFEPLQLGFPSFYRFVRSSSQAGPAISINVCEVIDAKLGEVEKSCILE